VTKAKQGDGQSGRRRLAREQRRETLLEAAREILFERGYGGLTMGRIARRAGVSKTLVYDHFPHRREVYLAILAEERVIFVQRIAPALAQGTREERVRAGVRAFLEMVIEYGDGYAEIYRNPVVHDPDLAVELLHSREQVIAMIASVYSQEVDRTVEDVMLPVHAVIGAMEGAADAILRLPPDARPPMDELVDLFATQVWSGLGGIDDIMRSGSGATVKRLRSAPK
jgi:AcrR family transcriptional regulator